MSSLTVAVRRLRRILPLSSDFVILKPHEEAFSLTKYMHRSASPDTGHGGKMTFPSRCIQYSCHKTHTRGVPRGAEARGVPLGDVNAERTTTLLGAVQGAWHLAPRRRDARRVHHVAAVCRLTGISGWDAQGIWEHEHTTLLSNIVSDDYICGK